MLPSKALPRSGALRLVAALAALATLAAGCIDDVPGRAEAGVDVYLPDLGGDDATPDTAEEDPDASPRVDVPIDRGASDAPARQDVGSRADARVDGGADDVVLMDVGPSPDARPTDAVSIDDRTSVDAPPADSGSRITVTIDPPLTTIPVGARESFVVAVRGASDERVTLSVREAGSGAVTPSGVYTAPAQPGTYHVVAASVADPSQAAVAEVTVRALQPRLLVGPSVVTLLPGGRVTLAAAMLEGAGAVRWSVEEAGGGTVDATGIYVAPATGGIFHVRATSVADPTLTDAATVRVVAGLGATLRPAGRSPSVFVMRPGQNDWIHLEVVGAGDTTRTLRWSAEGTSAAVVQPYANAMSVGGYPYEFRDYATAEYWAPLIEGTYLVTATDVADPRAVLSIPVVVRRTGAPRTITTDLPRVGGSLTALPDGRVVLAGGTVDPANVRPTRGLTSIDIFDPLRGRITHAGDLRVARYNHTATLLDDGTILFAGGLREPSSTLLASAELFDPATGGVTSVGDLNAARESHVATRLPSGEVLIVHGMQGPAGPCGLAEIYSPRTRSFRVLLAGPNLARGEGARLVTVDGLVYAFGGFVTGQRTENITPPEVFDPATETFSRVPFGPLTNLHFPGYDVAVAPLGMGRVLVSGLAPGVGSFASYLQTVVYDTRAHTSTALAPGAAVSRKYAQAIATPDGRVVVMGGETQVFYALYVSTTSAVEAFDEARGQLVPMLNMAPPLGTSAGTIVHRGDFAVGLPDGRVVIAGGNTCLPRVATGFSHSCPGNSLIQVWTP